MDLKLLMKMLILVSHIKKGNKELTDKINKALSEISRRRSF